MHHVQNDLLFEKASTNSLKYNFVSEMVNVSGKGLTVCVSVIPGDFARNSGEAMAAKQSLRRTMDEEKVKGFVDVLVARNITDGLSHL